MRAFTYYAPTRILFGSGTQRRAAGELKALGADRVLIVYGSQRVVNSGLIAQVTDTLKEEGIAWELLGGVVANPRLSLARKGVQRALEIGAKAILAVGGGSVIDTAKAVAIGTANPQTDLWDFWSGKKTVQKALPIGVILTIAAAGSETSDSAVLTNDDTREKRGINTDLQRPAFAILNPELTFSLPREQTAAGVADIMMHTMERYFVPWQGNHLSDAFAHALLKNVIEYGPRALENRSDYEAMSEIMWSASVSHVDLTGLGAQSPQGGRTGDWAVHQLGHELSGMFDSTHGATLTAVWGAWASYVCPGREDRFAQFGREVWQVQCEDPRQAAGQAIERTVNFFGSLGMPVCFSELGIGVLPDETIGLLAEKCSFGRTRTIGAYRVLDCEDIRKIYAAANR